MICKWSLWECELCEMNAYYDTGFLMLETSLAKSKYKSGDKKAQTLDLTDNEKIVSVAVHTNEDLPVQFHFLVVKE